MTPTMTLLALALWAAAGAGVWPFARCRRCGGVGRWRTNGGRWKYVYCSVCRGTGRRVRGVGRP